MRQGCTFGLHLDSGPGPLPASSALEEPTLLGGTDMATIKRRLKILRSGDAKSAFFAESPSEILDRHGPPTFLLSSSTKIDKCTNVDVLAKILYLTPGLFCSAATPGCLNACLGHSSGRMAMPTHIAARDRRTALYIEEPDYFFVRLRGELQTLIAEARRLGYQPAVRLNGSSDIAWERQHRQLLDAFPNLQFYDYTKIFGRMRSCLGIKKTSRKSNWPQNYHLTFSADRNNKKEAREILQHGGNVAMAFWPELPRTWWGVPVIDGDTHDARFLDKPGCIVGLRAKSPARVDLSGFTYRPCPECPSQSEELRLVNVKHDSHRVTHHRCRHCGFALQARWKMAACSR